MAYCTIDDIRDEGFEACDFTNRRVQMAIDDACETIERVTGRFFEPKNKTIRTTWQGSRDVLLEEPIISLDTVQFVNSDDSLQDPLEATDFVTFNRHVTLGLTRPDDRESPKLSLLFVRPPTVVPRVQPALVREIIDKRVLNLQLIGRFGYTDPSSAVARSIASDGTDAITAPDTIKMANGAFTEADVTGKITLAGTASNDGTFTIAAIVAPDTVRVKEQTLTTEGSGFTASISEFPQSGVTPRLIKRACRLLAGSYLQPSGTTDPFEAALSSGRVRRMAVRDQSIEFGLDQRQLKGATLTGIPQVDELLVQFVKPPSLRAV